MAGNDLDTIKLTPSYNPSIQALPLFPWLANHDGLKAVVAFGSEPGITFDDVYGAGASPMIVAHDASLQRLPPSRRTETVAVAPSPELVPMARYNSALRDLQAINRQLVDVSKSYDEMIDERDEWKSRALEVERQRDNANCLVASRNNCITALTQERDFLRALLNEVVAKLRSAETK